jgi:hypothetical protein
VAGVDLSEVLYLLPLLPRYTLYKYISLHLFTQGKRGGRFEKVQAALVYLRGQKYQHE